jgi:uncharacterized membrane protein YccC
LYEDKEKWSVGGSPNAANTFTILQRSKAIARLNRTLGRHADPCSTAVLMTCILFIAHEMLAGNHEEALKHMRSGIYLSYDRQSKQSTISSPAQYPDELTIQLQQLFGRLMMQKIFFIDTTPSE